MTDTKMIAMVCAFRLDIMAKAKESQTTRVDVRARRRKDMLREELLARKRPLVLLPHCELR
jgi:hypothetical protein